MDGHAVKPLREMLRGSSWPGKAWMVYTLCVIEIKKGEDAYQWLEKELDCEEKMHGAYAVLLWNANGEYVMPDKEFTVKIQVTTDGENLEVWHIDPNGEKTVLHSANKEGVSVVGTKPIIML